MTNRQHTDEQQEIKDQVVFDSFLVDSKEPAGAQSQVIRPAEVIVEEIQWQDENDHKSESISVMNEASGKPDKKRRFASKWLWISLLVFGLAGAELVLFVDTILTQQNWLSAGWLIVLVLVLILAVGQVFREWRGLAKLKLHNRMKVQASTMLSGPSIGQGEGFCEQLVVDFKSDYPDAIETWEKSLKPHHLDSEVLMLFDMHVVSQADKIALQHVTRHASASAAMIAVSPFALLDMGVVLWRNLVMLKQVSQCYGIKLTYWGRIHLIKSVFKTMLVAGAAEIISDAGNYALGAGITGKLSSRVAQGLGAGVLTTRIGIKAMQACRPLPWLAQKPPGISKLAQQLVADLKKLTS